MAALTQISIAAANASKAEGQAGVTPFTFAVTRTGIMAFTDSVNWTVRGTGAAPADAADFGGVLSGSVSFGPSERSSKIITVNVAGDTVVEPDESFIVILSGPTSNSPFGRPDILTQAAVGTALNDDFDISIAAANASKAEGQAGVTPFTFTVTRTGNTALTDSVNWAVSGMGAAPANAADFAGGVLPSGSVSFAPGETSKTITVNVVGDTVVEPDKSFAVTLSGPSSGSVIVDAAAGGTIINDDTLGHPVFRFFDTHDGGHFFTTSTAERDQVLATRKDMNFEGVGYDAVNPASSDPNAAPVYRFFDTHDGGHFFTISQAERDQVLNTRPDLKFEGIGYSEHTTQQAGDSAVYRFFETTSGGHFFTASAVERDTVMATRSDMRFEGIAFYAPT